MAVDYSKLSEEELKAIANNDYSKLSDATLEAIANKPKSAQAKPVEGAGGAAFGVYRPAGRRPESQNQNREANTDMAIQTIRGAASAPFTAAAGLPVDIGNVVYGQAIKPAIDFASSQAEQLRMPQYSDLPPAIQNAGNLMGGAYNTIVRGQEFQPLPEVPKAEKIPGIGDYGMNFYNQFVPGPDPANPAQQLAFAGSQALTGGLANKVVGGAIAAPRVIRGGANQVRTGAMEGVTNPVQRPGPNTAFAELSDQVYPNTTVKPYMNLTPEQQVQGLPALEASRQPSNSLFSGFLDKAALRLAPEGPQGGKLVPLEGRGLQAFTEQTTRDIFNKPSISNLGGLGGNIGGAIAGGLVGNIPGAIAGFFSPQYIRALEILGQRRLQNKAALQPNFQQQLGQAQQTAGRLGLEGSLPQTPLLGYTPRSGGGGAAGSVPPTMYVGPTGEATTNLAGTQVNMNPGSLAAPTAAANAAMATTQRIATGQPTTPRAPRAPAQPQQQFVLPDAGTHYAQAEQGSANFADTFNKAVSARTQDLLKNAKQTGQPLTAEQAGNLAFDEIKEWRRNNVDAFKPAPEPTGPVAPTATAEEAVAQFNPVKVDPELAMDQGIWKRLQDKTASGTPLEVNEQTAVRRITNKYGQDPFQTGDLKGSSILEAPKTETPTTKTITAEQQAKRDDFINNKVPERVKGMEQQRAANKETYADKAEAMREMAAENKAKGKKDYPMYGRYSEGQNMNPKDVFTERKAVADMVNQTTIANVTSKNKNIVVRRQGYDEFADGIGITLDWNTAPQAGKTIKETRQIMDKWMMDTINKELPELGLYSRKESLLTQGKQYNKELDAARAKMTPEEIAAEKAATEEILPDLQKRMDMLLGKGKSTPKTDTPKPTTPEVAGPVRPEGAVDAPKMTNAELLELIKTRSNKGKAPPDVMSMMTGKPNDVMGNVMMGKLKGNFDEFPTGSHTENGIRHEIIDNPDYTRMTPTLKEMVPNMPKKVYRQVDVKTGKVIEGAKSTKELEDVAEKMLKKAREGKKKQGK